MHSSLTFTLAQNHVADLRREAGRARRAAEARRRPVTIRAAAPGDQPALRRLAAMDSAPLPAGSLLLAEVDGQPRAAISLRDGSVIADPFHLTSELVELLRLRARRAA